jgi:hypothetical protein
VLTGARPKPGSFRGKGPASVGPAAATSAEENQIE